MLFIDFNPLSIHKNRHFDGVYVTLSSLSLLDTDFSLGLTCLTRMSKTSKSSSFGSASSNLAGGQCALTTLVTSTQLTNGSRDYRSKHSFLEADALTSYSLPVFILFVTTSNAYRSDSHPMHVI